MFVWSGSVKRCGFEVVEGQKQKGVEADFLMVQRAETLEQAQQGRGKIIIICFN